MAITHLNPYLHFPGNAREAIQLYERVLGAKVSEIIRFKDVPGMSAEGADAEDVLHSVLHIGPATVMVSDVPPRMRQASSGHAANMEVTIGVDDPADVSRIFDGLSAGGTALMPPHDTFYGGKLGVLVDRYGVRWMINCSPAAK
ncbi:MAG: VOC family protein [Myxococcaceae bacterium]|nr:VOC family protein [Myxococcaceae bacterium]